MKVLNSYHQYINSHYYHESPHPIITSKNTMSFFWVLMENIEFTHSDEKLYEPHNNSVGLRSSRIIVFIGFLHFQNMDGDLKSF